MPCILLSAALILGDGAVGGTAHAAQAAAPAAAQEPGTVVASTRTDRPIDNQALPVEVLERPRIEETTSMTPGDIALLLDGMQSLRVQSTSPELGTAMVRTQGLRGQYTRLLSDGVPLFFDHPGGVALVQIPPLDLARAEVIPGGASALFGANAAGGVVNLLSRRPGKVPEREVLFSQSTRNTSDALMWFSSPPTGTWSHSLLVGGHWQQENDLDDDGWSDMPKYSRATARTRVYWDNKQGKSVWGTAGVIFEKRDGGSALAHQQLETKSADGAMFGQMPFGKYTLAGAATLYVQSRVRDFTADPTEHERRESSTIELMLRGTAPRQTWVAGLAVDWYALRSPDEIASKYVSTRPGLFVHDDVEIASWLTASGSARLDHHNIYGLVLSPRGSVLAHNGPWAARFSAGESYFQPMPITEETEAAGLARLTYDGPLEKETVTNVSGGLTHSTPRSVVALTLFRTHIDHPAMVDRSTYTLRNETEPVVSHGVQVSATARKAPFTATGTYEYVHANERGGLETALTPRHSVGLGAAAGAEGRGRIGVQVSFTGAQRLDANPYRSTSESYFLVNVLGELPFGRWVLFANARNLTDVRQTDWDPIARPTRDVDGRWTVDAWAPLEGRVVNIGVKVSF